MKRADNYTIKQVGIPSLVLMERAALEMVRCMHKNNIDLSRTLVVCGSGNNGGDGFAVARILTEEGYQADILFVGNESSMSSECAVQKQIAENSNLTVFTEFPSEEYTVIVDAVFGVGLSREISGKYKEVIEWMNHRQCGKVAADIPSGVSARTGKILGTAFQADLTVSMACVKAGCELYPGKSFAGKTEAVSIGIDTAYFKNDNEVCVTCDIDDIPQMLPVRKPDSHKGTYGKILMITGTEGMAGAAYLSARAAYTVGAGLVQIYTAKENRAVLQELLPEAIISCYTEFDMSELNSLMNWADVICIGCGLGKSEVSEKILYHTVEYSEKPLIIDADGLNLLSKNMELLKNVKVPVTVTPHMMEMSRMTKKSVKEIEEDRIWSAEDFARSYPVVCVMKDSRTMVAGKGHHPFINLAGNSAMAKAGSGDVLAGVITGLAAQGMDEYNSAVLGVYLHACGGDKAKDLKGSYSVLAGDLIEGIGRIIQESESIKENI